jgi:hypothetical protein
MRLEFSDALEEEARYVQGRNRQARPFFLRRRVRDAGHFPQGVLLGGMK